MPFVTIPREKGENNASTWGNTRAHASDDITLDPPPIVRTQRGRERERERERGTFVLSRNAPTRTRSKMTFLVSWRNKESPLESSECDFRARATMPSALWRMMNRKNYLFPSARSKRGRERERERRRTSLADQVPCKTRPSSRHADPVFLRPGVSIYPPFSLSPSLFLFIFLAAPLPYKLISLLPALGPAPNN